HPGVPGYASALLIAAAAGSFLAAIGLAVGIRAPGWRLAVTVSALCTAAYLVSRTAGLPGFRETVGDWHNPLGTLGLLIEALLAAIYISLRVGWNVDAPEQRDWDTYFSRPAPADEGVPRAS
ncbi:MAG: hypothetical protein ACRDRN_00295, partial [Sciscionella sp.]